MIEIIPAIMPRNYDDLKNKIALVRGISPITQIDLCDGIFVNSRTWPFDETDNLSSHYAGIMREEEGMPFWEEIDFELDLMVGDAVENFDLYTKLGPKRVVFHLEAQADLESFRHFVEGIDMYVRDAIQIGVAINPDTAVEKIFPIVPHIDFVQCMGIEHIGFQGEPFDERALSHIKTLKEKFPNIIISVDGGVNLNTAPDILEAGADRLIVGSAIFKQPDIREAIAEFESLV